MSKDFEKKEFEATTNGKTYKSGQAL